MNIVFPWSTINVGEPFQLEYNPDNYVFFRVNILETCKQLHFTVQGSGSFLKASINNLESIFKNGVLEGFFTYFHYPPFSTYSLDDATITLCPNLYPTAAQYIYDGTSGLDGRLNISQVVPGTYLITAFFLDGAQTDSNIMVNHTILAYTSGKKISCLIFISVTRNINFFSAKLNKHYRILHSIAILISENINNMWHYSC